jgi:hypothetical protein
VGVERSRPWYPRDDAREALKRFAEVEKALLRPLPAVPPEAASWAKVKVHRHAHVQYEYNYYSVPFRLVGASLWLKATAAMVTLYREHEAVATYVRVTGRGQRNTVTDHMPPAAQAWQLQDTQWCVKEAERIGPASYALVHAMFGDTVLIRLRSVQGVLRLKQKYGAARLEAAWLGTLCSYLTICECIARVGSEYHFLWGQYEYKYRLLGVQRDLDCLVVYRSRAHVVLCSDLALTIAVRGYLRAAKVWLRDRASSKDSVVPRLALNVLRRMRNSR